MILKPHRHANHHLVLTTLAVLERDHPEEAEVLRGLVVTLYGPVVVPVYAALLRAFASPRAVDAVDPYVEDSGPRSTRAGGSSSC